MVPATHTEWQCTEPHFQIPPKFFVPVCVTEGWRESCMGMNYEWIAWQTMCTGYIYLVWFLFHRQSQRRHQHLGTGKTAMYVLLNVESAITHHVATSTLFFASWNKWSVKVMTSYKLLSLAGLRLSMNMSSLTPVQVLTHWETLYTPATWMWVPLSGCACESVPFTALCSSCFTSWECGYES